MNFETKFRKNIVLVLLGEEDRSLKILSCNIGKKSLIQRKIILTQVFREAVASQ